MSRSRPVQSEREAGMLLRQFAEQAFSRAAGAPLIGGNSVRILKNAAENYPAWLTAIHAAQRAYNLEIAIARVGAVHCAEDPVAARLERKMDVLA